MSWSQPTENSVASLAEGIERFDGVELDLRLTCDGELVLLHDRELAVQGTTQFVEDCTLDEVKSHGFDSFDDLISNRQFLKSWTEEAKFVCLELKIPHPASKAGESGSITVTPNPSPTGSRKARAKARVTSTPPTPRNPGGGSGPCAIRL